MQKIGVQNAVGEVLGEDITVADRQATASLLCGRILTQEDVNLLSAEGIEEINLVQVQEDIVHEDEAALRVANAVCGDDVAARPAGAGHMLLVASAPGILKVDTRLLFRVNDRSEIVCATLQTNQLVQAGQAIGGVQVIPLVVEQRTVASIETMCRARKVLSVAPLRALQIGLIITGSNVAEGKQPDEFGPVLTEKFKALGSNVARRVCVSGGDEEIPRAIRAMQDEGMQLIAVTGGMSVQPSDWARTFQHTPAAIRKAGGEVVCYGGPVMPGALFLLAYLDETPIIGLPGCVVRARAKVSLLDLVLPRLLAGEVLTRQDFIQLAHGGFCRNCDVCTFPACGFGKG